MVNKNPGFVVYILCWSLSLCCGCYVMCLSDRCSDPTNEVVQIQEAQPLQLDSLASIHV